MKKYLLTLLCALFTAGGPLYAAGPFDPDQWPSVANPAKIAHYFSTDGGLEPLGAGWSSTLSILSGGDQSTAPISLRGHQGLKVTSSNLNTADSGFTEWADDETIDILMQVYGDAGVFGGNGLPRNFNFLIGTLPELAAPMGGQVPADAGNRKWNWVLFRIPNTARGSDGSRMVGSIPANAQGDFVSGGVNGGTIRLEGVPNLTVRVIAFGEQGAFGEPSDYNTFEPADGCLPEPETNHVFLDLQNNNASHLTVFNNGDQTTEIIPAAGPVADPRRAVRALGSLMNFGITDDYLGLPCNDPRAVKICVEFYDDPALTGARFGPGAFATDATGGVGFVDAARRYTLQGSGLWKRIAWTVPAVSLAGINTAPLTGGPRLAFENGKPAISRFDLAVLRVTPHLLAGLDPLANCYEDPNVCTDAYGNYAEMDLANGILDGLAPGTSGGDQNMIQEEAGPASDRRMAIRPALDDGTPDFAHTLLNLAITGEVFGPSTQPNAHLAICMTYYDDPSLTGQSFRPEVYQTDRNGVASLAFTPGNIAVVLQGTDRWREAYFELPDVKFLGVNQGTQAAARFSVSGKIFFSRARYAVIRPCGPFAHLNRLAECKSPSLSLNIQRAAAGNTMKLTWPNVVEGWILESTTLSPPDWQPVTPPPTLETDHWTVPFASGESARFFRLRN